MTVEGGAYAQPPGHELAALRPDRLLSGLVAAVAVCLILAAVLMAMWAYWFALVLAAALAIAVAATIIAGDRRSSDQDMLLWALAIAVGRGMPLTSALEALADLRSGRARRRLLALVGLLDAGAPLPDALALVPGILPGDATALLAVGWRSGRLAPALREAAEARGVWRAVRSAVLNRIAYFFVVFLLMKVIVGFGLTFVMPKFQAIFRDFDAPLPWITAGVIQAGHLIFKYAGPILVVTAVFEGVLPLALPLALGGWLDGVLPWLDRLFPSRHAAPILRALACVVEGEQPVPAGIATLVRHYPGRWVQGRLALALHDICDGGDCWQALRDRGLIRPADAAVLESAARVGNLPWALRETADGAERRSLVRLNAWMVTLTTAIVVGLGILVLLINAAFFIPLIRLTDSVPLL